MFRLPTNGRDLTRPALDYGLRGGQDSLSERYRGSLLRL